MILTVLGTRWRGWPGCSDSCWVVFLVGGYVLPRPAGISPRRATDFLVARQESKQRNAPSSPPLRGALAPSVVGGRPCELASLRHAGPHDSAVNALRSAAHKGRAHRARD